jgi:transcriptional regulator with XRE-family HTH domain
MKYLKFWRLVRGFTQKEAADKVGVEQGTYCDYENGRKKPHPRHYEGLAEMTGRPIEEVVSKLHKLNPSELAGMQAVVAK